MGGSLTSRLAMNLMWGQVFFLIGILLKPHSQGMIPVSNIVNKPNSMGF